MKKTVLVTGASGFVGQYFVNNANDFKIIEVDLLNKGVDEVDFKNVDVVLHLAALVHQMEGASDDEYFKINRDLALEVAIRAKKEGVKCFVLMSTVKVYGENTDKEPWDEESACNPTDAYGKSKLEAEISIQKEETDKFKVAIIRSPLVYGPAVKANMLNLIKLIDKFPIIPLGNINNKRSMVYIANLVSLIGLVIKQEPSGVFLASDNKSLSTTGLVNLIKSSIKKKTVVLYIPSFVKCIVKFLNPQIYIRLFGSLELNAEKTNEVLNFVPPFSIERGITEMVEWYKKRDD